MNINSDFDENTAFNLNMKTNEENLKHELNKTFSKWSRRATIHGVPHIVQGKRKSVRFLWVTFFLLCIAFCFYVNAESMIDYYQYKVSVSIKEEESSSFYFPTLQICNMNGFKQEMFKQLILNYTDGLLDSQIDCVKSSNDWTSCFNGTVKADEIMSFFKVKFLSKVDNRVDYSMNLSDSLISCFHHSVQYQLENFTEFWHPIYGNCFLFNDGTKGPKAHSYMPGADFGFQLQLLLKREDDRSVSEYQNAIHLFIKNNAETVAEFEITAGQETHLIIKREERRKLPAPYSDCIKNLKPFSSFSKKIFEYFSLFNLTTYSRKYCERYCYEEKSIENCNCTTNDRILSVKNASRCSTSEERACNKRFFDLFYSKNTLETCDFVCRDECTKIKYQIEKREVLNPKLRQIDVDSKIMYQNLGSLVSRDYAMYPQNSFLKLVVYYRELSTTIYEDNPQMTSKQLIGNIGGQLGLFIGISVLSVIEIMELVSSFLFTSLKHCKSEIGKRGPGFSSNENGNKEELTEQCSDEVSRIRQKRRPRMHHKAVEFEEV